MNSVIENVLNEGVPLNTPLLIDIQEFFELFDFDGLIQEYRENVKEIVSSLSNIMDYYGGNIILPTYVTLSLDENNCNVLRFSGENFYFSLATLFIGIDVDELLEACDHQEKFAILKEKVLNVKNETELKQKFPILHKLYEEQTEANKNFIELENLVQDKNTPLELKLHNVSKITNNFKELYSHFDLKREQQFAHECTLSLFLERIMKAVGNLINVSMDVIHIYASYKLDISQFKEEDKEKLNLYVAAKFMEMVESETVVSKQRYLFYLTHYFKENVEKQLTRVKIKLNGSKVTPLTLYQRYKNALACHPDLLAVHFSRNDFRNMNREEVEEFIEAYLSELSANWELIPSEDPSIERKVRMSVKRVCRNMSDEEKREKEEKLLNLYFEKKNFFDSTDPYFRIKGKLTFDGYVGFIYANGLVILEQFYEDVEKLRIADKKAIYVMEMEDFYELSKHSKPYLAANHLCRKIIHRGAWQQRVLACINQKNTGLEVVSETRKLILEKNVEMVNKKI